MAEKRPARARNPRPTSPARKIARANLAETRRTHHGKRDHLRFDPGEFALLLDAAGLAFRNRHLGILLLVGKGRPRRCYQTDPQYLSGNVSLCGDFTPRKHARIISVTDAPTVK